MVTLFGMSLFCVVCIFSPSTVATVPLSDELKGSLRTLKPKGNLLEEHVGRMATTKQVAEKKKKPKRCARIDQVHLRFALRALLTTLLLRFGCILLLTQPNSSSRHKANQIVREVQMNLPLASDEVVAVLFSHYAWQKLQRSTVIAF